MSPLRFAELFAGAGGLSLGLERAGLVCAWHAEISPHARAVLRHHWPDVPLYGDVTLLDGRALTDSHGPIDLLSGGSPCQDLSVAGKRAGLDGARSSLFYEQMRLWDETGADLCLWENVDGARSSNAGADFGAVLHAFVGAAVPVPSDGWRAGGVAAGPRGVAAWRILDAQFFGVPQRRRRVFVLGTRTGRVDPAEILSLAEGVRGDSQARREAREGAACGAPRGVGFQSSQSGVRSVDTFATLDANYGCGTPIVFNETGHEAWRDEAVAGSLNAHEAREAHTIVADREGASVVGTLNTRTCRSVGSQDAEANNLRAEAGIPRRLMPVECERLMSWPDRHTATGTRENGTRYELSDGARYKLCGNGVASVQTHWIGWRLSLALRGEP